MFRSSLIAAASAVAIVALAPGSALGASPAAVWHMDETSGSVMHDSSGHGYNGTLSNVQVGVAGFSGSKAYGFNGTSSKVVVPDVSGLNPGTKDLVVSVHVAFSAVPADD